MYETLCVLSSLGYIESTKVGDALLDYGRIEWQKTLKALEIAPHIGYNVPKGFGKIWCAKGHIATRSNLVRTWKVRPLMGFNT